MPTSTGRPSQEALTDAAERMSKYEWMAAAESYREALQETESLDNARVTELLAKCYFKAAFQSEGREEFKRRMQLAEAAYDRARALYEEAGSEALSKKSKARGLFATFWLKDEPGDRRSIIGRTISVAEDAARLFERQGDRRSLGETGRDILGYLLEASWLAREWSVAKEVSDKAFRFGDSAVAELEAIGDGESLLESLDALIFFLFDSGDMVEPARYLEHKEKAERLLTRMTEISQKIGTPLAFSLAGSNAGLKAHWVEGDYAKALDIFETTITTAQGTRDSYLIGRLAMYAVYGARNAGLGEEDIERRRELFQRGIRLLPMAANNSDTFSHGGLISLALEGVADCYTGLARFVETEPEKKRTDLSKAVEIARRVYSYKDYHAVAGHALIKAMYFLSVADIDPEEKSKLLTEALPLGEETVREADLLYRHWNQGVDRNYLALIKAELARKSQDSRTKVELLQGAVDDMQQCVELCAEWAMEQWSMSALSSYEEWYGDILLQLYELTRETGTAHRAIKVYEDAIGYLRKLEYLGPIGAIDWKIAKVNDTIGDYKQASQAFKRAADDYERGGKKIRGSATLFGELGSYMESWSLIEQARLHHGEEQYLLAAEDYTKAATALQPTRTWGQLSKFYTACSFFEGGEALSRQERQEAAIESFTEAVKTFRSAKSELDNRLRGSLGSQEKQELSTWRSVADGRERLCQGRILLEEAKVLDRKGEAEASAAKYGSASEVFRALMVEAEAEQSRRELETLALFCQAWAKMKEAETRTSPDLYAEAAESFNKVEKVATRRRFHLLALANASICRSLEAGTQFRRTRNTQLYSEIKKELETATDYYQEAALQNAADWTRATGKLFDALVYLADAATERESTKKKTELFHLAEKHLQLAAKLYEQAGFPAKKSEALKHLERAREEKELLLTPIEALAESPALTGVTASPVSLIRDQALGLERFDAANVVGNLSLHQKELGVGSDLTLELEMANVGKTAATLMKLENIAAEGLELDKEKIPYRVEDNYIDLKGKRLEYLKTHELKIPMKAMRKGAFELRPRILFVDEKGNYRSYEFDPATVTVRELGISGWLKGPK